jgi:hypothetical protein
MAACTKGDVIARDRGLSFIAVWGRTAIPTISYAYPICSRRDSRNIHNAARSHAAALYFWPRFTRSLQMHVPLRKESKANCDGGDGTTRQLVSCHRGYSIATRWVIRGRRSNSMALLGTADLILKKIMNGVALSPADACTLIRLIELASIFLKEDTGVV